MGESKTKNYLSWLETCVKFIRKYGIWEVLRAMIIMVMISFTIYICSNPGIIFEKFEQYSKDKHEIELYNRSERDAELKKELPHYLNKYHADRVFVIQYHNGTKDWQHGTMRFELCSEHTKSMKHNYDDFNLTWLNMPYYLKEHEYFIGSIEELKNIDSVLYEQLLPYNVKFAAFIILRTSEGMPSGIFGFTWPEVAIDLSTMREKIHNYLIEDRVSINKLI